MYIISSLQIMTGYLKRKINLVYLVKLVEPYCRGPLKFKSCIITTDCNLVKLDLICRHRCRRRFRFYHVVILCDNTVVKLQYEVFNLSHCNVRNGHVSTINNYALGLGIYMNLDQFLSRTANHVICDTYIYNKIESFSHGLYFT